MHYIEGKPRNCILFFCGAFSLVALRLKPVKPARFWLWRGYKNFPTPARFPRGAHEVWRPPVLFRPWAGHVSSAEGVHVAVNSLSLLKNMELEIFLSQTKNLSQVVMAVQVVSVRVGVHKVADQVLCPVNLFLYPGISCSHHDNIILPQSLKSCSWIMFSNQHPACK